jgi:hypothetical protein
MNNLIKLTLSTFAISLIVGCGGSSSSSTNTDNQTPPNNQPSNTKIYNVTVVSDASLSPDTCKGATGTLIIKEDKVSGTVKSDWGKIYDITGTYISETSKIEGGFADARTQVATYSGTANDNNASGTWEDSLGCYGTWSGTIK